MRGTHWDWDPEKLSLGRLACRGGGLWVWVRQRNQEASATVWVGRAMYWNLFHMEINSPSHIFLVHHNCEANDIFFDIYFYLSGCVGS